jgi:hypothetical protein
MKKLLLPLFLIPNLVTEEELNFFCEQTDSATINFADGSIKKTRHS